MSLPQKRFFRQRAHSNPLADHSLEFPSCPSKMDWSEHFPLFFTKLGERFNDEENSMKTKKKVEFADVGCGYGGLLVGLADTFPEVLSLGLELRAKVADYAHKKILALREQNKSTGKYQNISIVRANAMKYLPYFFEKGQLKKIFFLFPDPHFKKSKHKWRIISPHLLSDYAYFLAVGGLLYTVTDVAELYEWEIKHLSEHPLFMRISNESLKGDATVDLILNSSEESKKVTRQGGDNKMGEKYWAVFQRVEDPFIKLEKNTPSEV
ncbi:tRNA (guanine-N(7)-)-methyltransferase-like isoform X2 [Zophobas morio]|uniref:tRNA (guanine-N(7)-)-methyltransferase-like isoform X2 n=1 Tax=Zophobas morio TaxID=2755281 RepID=UPI0030838B92